MIEVPDRKTIGASLQSNRKKAGFKSAKAFASFMGLNPNTYTDYEQGRIGLSFELAWQIADALHCTLDELGGRGFSPPAEQPAYADPYQAELNDCYEASTAEGRSVILGTARGQRELSKKVPEGRVPEADRPMSKAM